MAEAQVKDRVKEAYIRPIRSVLVIDDDFHQYGAEKEGKDPKRARSLWDACRQEGFLCDIDDGAKLLNNENPIHLTKSDLVILDYHLQGDDPKWALQLLCRLAPSDHASIVVVYTNASKLMDVRREIGAHLRGGLAHDQLCGSLEIQTEWERVETKITHRPSAELIDSHISGNTRACRTDTALLEELKTLSVPDKLKAGVAEAYYESLLLELLAGNPAPRTQGLIQLGGGANDTPPWVYVNNLFVVCVQKTDDNLNDGTLVFKALEDALCDWKPDFMLSAVAYARAEFARGGFQLERSSIGDQRLKSGWLFHAWSGSPEEQPNRLRALFERLISSYSKRVLSQMIGFGTVHVPKCDKPENGSETLNAAIKEFCGDQRDLENGVIHALNEFLVIDERPGFVETGTIFSRSSDGDEPTEVYVCVTPACDLVPREPRRKDTWEYKLHPARAVVAIRAEMTNASREQLLKAEDNRYVFLNVVGKPKAVILVGEKPPVPTLEWLFLEDMGRITNDRLFAMEVGRAVAPDPIQASVPVPVSVPIADVVPAVAVPVGAVPVVTIKAAPADQAASLLVPSHAPPAASPAPAHPPLMFVPTEMRVLGQMRALYASRILQSAGQHLARIGVDFVNFPEQPKPPKKDKTPPAPKADPPPDAKAEGLAPKPETTSPPSAGPPPAVKPDPAPPAKPDAPPPKRQPE